MLILQYALMFGGEEIDECVLHVAVQYTIESILCFYKVYS